MQETEASPCAWFSKCIHSLFDLTKYLNMLRMILERMEWVQICLKSLIIIAQIYFLHIYNSDTNSYLALIMKFLRHLTITMYLHFLLFFLSQGKTYLNKSMAFIYSFSMYQCSLCQVICQALGTELISALAAISTSYKDRY